MAKENDGKCASSFLSFVSRAWLFEHCMSAEAYAKMGAVPPLISIYCDLMHYLIYQDFRSNPLFDVTLSDSEGSLPLK